MNLNTITWRTFAISDYFDVVAGNYHYVDDYTDGKTPYVTASNINNGIAAYIDLEPEFKGNCITTGKVGCTAFYQPNDFCATNDVNILIPKFDLSPNVGLFIAMVINYNENYRWTYGRQCRVGNTKNIRIKLPAGNDGRPDFEWIEVYMSHLHNKPVTTSVARRDGTVRTKSWNSYRLDELFDFKKGTRLTKEDMEEGPVNYLGAIDSNNGVRQKITCEQGDQCKPNCITINYNGSVGESFYQAEPFWASDDVNILYAKPWWKLDQYLAMFIITIIKKNKYKFDYGRKWTLKKMKESMIVLPSAADGRPDFKGMREYIQSLPYSDRI